jgi:hypothetical protein
MSWLHSWNTRVCVMRLRHERAFQQSLGDIQLRESRKLIYVTGGERNRPAQHGIATYDRQDTGHMEGWQQFFEGKTTELKKDCSLRTPNERHLDACTVNFLSIHSSLYRILTNQTSKQPHGVYNQAC